ncbi:MAG: hypothetical protein GTO17_08785 [Candidatus Aminicenantes bacterium]|nr:hypothetical protein [Candidatus Aminicenantes bacterium]
MNLFQRLQGIFFSPQPTLKGVTEKPVWVDALVVLLVLIGLFSFLTAPYLQKDSLQIMKDNVRMQERLGEENYNRMIDRLENPSQSMVILQTFGIIPVSFLVGLLFSSLIILVMGRFTSTEGKYVQVFAVLLHANFVDKILGNALRLILVFTRKSVMQTTTSLALFFPRLEVTSSAYLVLTQFDFFQLWLFGLLGFGLSQVLKIELKRALVISYAFWLLKSLLYIALGLIRMRYM